MILPGCVLGARRGERDRAGLAAAVCAAELGLLCCSETGPIAGALLL